MNKTVFCDFDGVLRLIPEPHPDDPSLVIAAPAFDQDCLRRLQYILDMTGAKVVISSHWRNTWTLEEIQSLLHPWITPEMFHEEWRTGTCSKPNHRWLEVRDWLNRMRTDSWVILDDTLREFSFSGTEMLDHLILTNNRFGLQDSDAEKAIAILNR